jgi:hypothetical protein
MRPPILARGFFPAPRAGHVPGNKPWINAMAALGFSTILVVSNRILDFELLRIVQRREFLYCLSRA